MENYIGMFGFAREDWDVVCWESSVHENERELRAMFSERVGEEEGAREVGRRGYEGCVGVFEGVIGGCCGCET